MAVDETVTMVSINPSAEWLIAYCARVSSPQNQANDPDKLLRYCIKHGHWSPFEMAHMVVEVRTTRQISAQIIRHRSFAFQEFSQRYAEVKERPEFPEMRLAGTTNRQSSLSAPLDSGQRAAVERAENLVELLYDAYGDMVKAGIATESARAVLPLCTPTRLYMAGTIRSFLHYVQVRSSPDTQAEHRKIAEDIAKILEAEVPVVWEAFKKHCLQPS